MMSLAKRISERFEDRRLKLNVGGVVFETMRSTLQKRPATRLAKLADLMETDETWDMEKQEYFFDRHPGVFSSIIQCYRTDELHTEHNLCGNIIKHELDFWGLTELDIEPCCWGHYCRFMENKKTLTALDDNFTSVLKENMDKPPEGFAKFKRNMWIFLEDPSSSKSAKAYAIISMFFVLLSIAVFVLETHSWFRVIKDGVNGTLSRTVSGGYLGPSHCSCIIQEADGDYTRNSEPHDAMTYLDYLCATFFTLEFLVRVFFAPNKLEFCKQPLNIIDFLCLVPHFTSIIIKTVSPSDNAGNILRSVLALRVIRVLRIFKLMKHYTAFKILVYTIKVSTKELLLLVVFLFSGVLVFASLIYYAEPDTFNSIPVGFWWGIVTMTTVGYGDKVPYSIGGYLLGSVCVLCGVLTVAFTVPIVVNNFTLYYAHAQSRNQLPPQKKRELQQKLIMKNQKATEFIKKLAINVRHRRKTQHDVHAFEGDQEDEEDKLNKLEDLKTPRVINSRTSKDSGIDACLHDRGSPASSSQAGRYKDHGMTEVDIDGGTGVVGGEGSSRESPRIQTVSEIVPELELPGAADVDFGGSQEMKSKTPQMLETEQLLHNLQEFDDKQQEERRRQMDRVYQKREEVRARATPRTSPSVRPLEEPVKKQK